MDLGTFEGLPVVGVAIEISNAGGGLQDAMKIDPALLHHGQRVQIVLEGEVRKVRMDPADKKAEYLEEVTRVHVIHADNASLTDDAGVRALLDAQKLRVQQAKDAANNQTTVESQLVAKEHNDGEHTEPVEGCEACDLEAELERQESDDETKDGDE